jgi:predicted RNase H-like nuclease (RuvC/YqgF family)
LFPNYRNMPETKRKICVWVSTDMYNNVVSAGYDSPTVAVIKGFELLLSEEERRKDAGNLEQIAAQITAENNNLKNDIERLNTSIKAAPDPMELMKLRTRVEDKDRHIETLKAELEKAPDSVEFTKVQERLEGLQRLTEEKDKRIEDLTREIETLNVFAHYFKNVEVKQLEPPGEKKKPWYKFW